MAVGGPWIERKQTRMKSFRASRKAARQRKLRPVPWWAILLAGIALVIIGALLIVTPKNAATGLFLVLGALCVLGGLGAIGSIAFTRESWVTRLLAGAGLILLGLALLIQPLLSAYLVAAIILWFLGTAAILGGIFLVLQAFSYAGWLRGVLGALCTIIGAMLILGSTVGPLKAPWAYGIAAVAGGVGAIVAAFRKKQQPQSQV
jgi:uncharacterized membrane protein HdeD (DUF308 family)